MNSVQIVIVTFNRLEYTRNVLEALFNVKAGYDYELTIVDNNSTDGTKQFLLRLKNENIKQIVFLPKNKGVSYAFNLGWYLIPKDYYLKLDNDMVVQKENWLGDIVNVSDTIQTCGVFGYNVEVQSYPVEVINGIKVRPKRTGNLGGACYLIPKRTFEKFGYWYQFGERYYGEEDAEMSARISVSGFLNVYMEDEHAFIHLPAGRADLSGERKDYRDFKDNERMLNLKSNSEYHRRMISVNLLKNLYVDFKP